MVACRRNNIDFPKKMWIVQKKCPIGQKNWKNCANTEKPRIQEILETQLPAAALEHIDTWRQDIKVVRD
jgi:hypothetical protein